MIDLPMPSRTTRSAPTVASARVSGTRRRSRHGLPCPLPTIKSLAVLQYWVCVDIYDCNTLNCYVMTMTRKASKQAGASREGGVLNSLALDMQASTTADMRGRSVKNEGGKVTTGRGGQGLFVQ